MSDPLVERYPHLERERVFRLPDAPQPDVSETWDNTAPSTETSFDAAERRFCSVCGIVQRFPPWLFEAGADAKGHCSNHGDPGDKTQGRQVVWREVAP